MVTKVHRVTKVHQGVNSRLTLINKANGNPSVNLRLALRMVQLILSVSCGPVTKLSLLPVDHPKVNYGVNQLHLILSSSAVFHDVTHKLYYKSMYKIRLGHQTFSKQLAEMTKQLAKCSDRMIENDFTYKYSMSLCTCTYTSAD